MAICNGNANGVVHLSSKLQIEAIQSVVPTKPTEPRLSLRVMMADNLGSGDLGKRIHVVLCYNKASKEDSGWLVAGWIKESLGRALVEKPLFAGRLRKTEDDSEGDFEIVSNDSGIRLVEAKVHMNLSNFLDLKNNVETDLVFWEDIHEPNPQYSPLFYVMVTNFDCGGFSIGISCSIFLADPYVLTSFMKRWSKIHNNMVSETDTTKTPTFYFPYLMKSRGSPPTLPIASTTSNKANYQTIIFKMPIKILNLRDDDVVNTCIEEAEDKLGKKLSSKLCLVVKEISEDVKVKIFSRQVGISQKPSGPINGLVSSSWDDLEVDTIRFNEENKVIHISCWIYSGNEDLVLIVPSLSEANSGKNILITTTI